MIRGTMPRWTFCTTAVPDSLAELGRELRGSGAELVLTEVSDAILHRIATTGIDADLTVVPRLEDAVLVRPALGVPTPEAQSS